MKSSKPKKFVEYGPYSHWNWLCQSEEKKRQSEKKKPPRSAIEIQLFSDAQFTGSRNIEHGPYFVMNAEALHLIEPYQSMHARLILKCEHYLDPNQDPTMGPLTYTDTTRYHGGSLPDEMAALYSLCWGVRLRAGGVVREFSPWNTYGAYGEPRTPMPDESPVFFPPLNGRYVLPWHPIKVKLDEIQERIQSYILLSPPEAAALVRAARLYQHAVWLAESDPAISWLLLTSAVETAASDWYKRENISLDHEEQLKQLKPELFKKLNSLESHGAEAIAIVGEELQGLIGSAAKFRGFLLRFFPEEPPSNRPALFQIEWSQEAMEHVFKKIYRYRSEALHGGTPFPQPMCSPPSLDPQNNVPNERPFVGLALSTCGASWAAKDVPIHFHIFEYIVRHSLLNWWQSMAEVAQDSQ